MMNENSPFIKLVFPTKMLFLFSVFMVCLYLVTVVSSLLQNKLGAIDMVLNLQVAMQNILVFAFPAFALAVFVSRKPISYLRLNSAPRLKSILFVLAAFVIAMPAMNYIIDWNENIRLPESMSAIEQTLRQYEELAKQATDNLTKGKSFGGIVVLVLTVGCLTGFGEEVFFRGMFTRLIIDKPCNKHLAIWIGALLFSLLHFQFYGFVPRMLLGAFFGYLMVWSGCLWLPIIAHAINNSLAIVSIYLCEQKILPARIDEVGGDNLLLLIVSVALTTVLIWQRHRFFDNNKAEIN